ncbi:MAG: two-component sensor histidine kinase [Deltaproteobacteria bacterium]|nr:two-component sensor histidine kinase [Deltaproteobacteria bacterium]
MRLPGKPKFWDHYDAASSLHKPLFNFRRIWFLAVLVTALVTLAPLIFITLMDYRATQKSAESEIRLRTARLVSNTRRSVSFFLEERQAATEFITQLHPCRDMENPTQLGLILENLKKSFGGFVDLGIIAADGIQKVYVGPYDLKGKNYRDQEWFRQVVDRGGYISDVFMGFRNAPHIVIARKHELPDGTYHVLRATLDTERFNHLMSGIEVSGSGDAFLINHRGALQTPSRLYGSILKKIELPVPAVSPQSEILETRDRRGETLIIGYAYISDSPFVLMIVKPKKEQLKEWYAIRMELIGFLVLSITVILIVILGTATYLVGQVFDADRRRVAMLHKVEYANKLASIGRLAAGVAHEINNPLAIINEKAGLIKDIFSFKPETQTDPRLSALVDSIIASVERCSTITRRLLRFARHLEVSMQTIQLEELIREVLGFVGKEAEYRSIEVAVEVANEIPAFESDRGKLQQIFLNIINNAFAAMEDGGRLKITLQRVNEESVSVSFADTGRGIPVEDLKRVFEPFFTTKASKGGTGLGLSITYGLVRELGGTVQVESTVGQGTRFTVTIPLKYEKKNRGIDADITRG